MSTPSLTRSRTLVVEDDAVVRELLLALLDMQGHEVDVVDSGIQALHRLTTEPPPDFVLTDMLMPGIHGGALVDALRDAMPASARLVGMSGSQPGQKVLDSLDGFVLKPFGYADLEEALQRATMPTPFPRSQGSSLHDVEVTPSVRGPVLDETIFHSLSQSFRPGPLAELYNLTLNDVELRRKKMEDLAASGDLALFQREAHSIKGLCGMVGARELGEAAGALESATTFDVFAIRDIQNACARLRRMLDTKFANHTAPAGEHE